MPSVRRFSSGRRKGEVNVDVLNVSTANTYAVFFALACSMPPFPISSLFSLKFKNLSAVKTYNVFFSNVKHYHNGDSYIKEGLLIAFINIS